jgi:Methyltransferase FkbM domain
MELVSHHGWEAMAHSATLDAPWLFNTSTMGRLARCLMQRSLRHAHPTAATKRFLVQAMPLSRMLEDHNVATVNFLKIDCEGSEYEVLRSPDPANWARIQRVVIEYHDIGGDLHHRELGDFAHQRFWCCGCPLRRFCRPVRRPNWNDLGQDTLVLTQRGQAAATCSDRLCTWARKYMRARQC